MNKNLLIWFLIFFSLIAYSQEENVSENKSQQNVTVEKVDTTKEVTKFNFEISKAASEIKTFTDAIGLIPEEAFAIYGTPIKIESIKNPNSNQIEVITEQRDGYYFFWNDNKIWQIAFPKNYTGDFCKIKIGSTIKEVENILGVPYKKSSNILYFRLTANVFPIFARLVFNEKGVIEAYIYRADI